MDEQGVRFNAVVHAGQYIRLAGEDIRQGADVLPAGVMLGATQLPLLASLGVAKVQVIRKLRWRSSPLVTSYSRSVSRCYNQAKSMILTVLPCT